MFLFYGLVENQIASILLGHDSTPALDLDNNFTKILSTIVTVVLFCRGFLIKDNADQLLYKSLGDMLKG